MPDAFAGAIYAIEGIRDAAVLLNGPTGCKFFYGAISGRRMPRGLDFDPVAVPEKFFFRQDRIPCTYLDGHDYVYGAEEKIREMLQLVQEERDHAFLCLLNSPGAALIGDDLERFLKDEVKSTPFMAIESIPPSEAFAKGFQQTLIQLLHHIEWNEKKSGERPKVNLLGFHLYQKHFEGDIEEIKRLLAMIGVEVNTVFAAGDRIAQIQSFRDADLNLVVYPEFGKDLAQHLQDQTGMPYLCLDHPPVGFDATYDMMELLANHFAKSLDDVEEEIGKARGRAWQSLNYFSALTGLPKGASFAIKADPSQTLALLKFLNAYMGMIPLKVECNEVADSIYSKRVEDYLKEKQMSFALKNTWEDTPIHILLSDGNTNCAQKYFHNEMQTIEVALPEQGYEELLPRTLLGSRGALYLIEMIINGLKKTI